MKDSSHAELLGAGQRTADAELKAAAESKDERQRLVDANANQADAIQRLAGSESKSLSLYEKAREEFENANEQKVEAQRATDEAERELGLKRGDRDFRHDELEMARMVERLDRIKRFESASRFCTAFD